MSPSALLEKNLYGALILNLMHGRSPKYQRKVERDIISIVYYYLV